jgi:hypothetical protein
MNLCFELLGDGHCCTSQFSMTRGDLPLEHTKLMICSPVDSTMYLLEADLNSSFLQIIIDIKRLSWVSNWSRA